MRSQGADSGGPGESSGEREEERNLRDAQTRHGDRRSSSGPFSRRDACGRVDASRYSRPSSLGRSERRRLKRRSLRAHARRVSRLSTRSRAADFDRDSPAALQQSLLAFRGAWATSPTRKLNSLAQPRQPTFASSAAFERVKRRMSGSGFEVGLLGQLDASRRDALLRILASHAQTACSVAVDELFFGRGADSDASSLLRLRRTRRSDVSDAPWSVCVPLAALSVRELHIAQPPKPATRDGGFDVLIRPIVACPIYSSGSLGSARSQAAELAQALGFSCVCFQRRAECAGTAPRFDGKALSSRSAQSASTSSRSTRCVRENLASLTISLTTRPSRSTRTTWSRPSRPCPSPAPLRKAKHLQVHLSYPRTPSLAQR